MDFAKFLSPPVRIVQEVDIRSLQLPHPLLVLLVDSHPEV
jgi:hypothetical protein